MNDMICLAYIGTGTQASYGLWIGIAAALTLFFGALFVVFFNRYRRNQKDAERRARRQERLYGEDRAPEGYDNMDNFQNMGANDGFQDASMESYGATAAVENAPVVDVEVPTAQNAAIPHTEEDRKKQARGIYVGKVHNIGRRSSQQDSFGISKDGQALSSAGKGVFAIVADGMGGLSNGGEVSARVTMSMMTSFDRMNGQERGDKQLLTMLNQANDDVNAMLKSAGQGKSGSTVVAVLIRDSSLSWITVGDSHIYLYREGALMQVNRDHVYSVDLDEMAARGEISTFEAAKDPQRKALTSYIGMGKLAKIDRNIRPLQLQSKDRILLMTDGVFGTLTDEEITAAMKLPVTESCNALDQMIQGKNRPAQDNYTALILEYI